MIDPSHPADSMIRAVHAVSVALLLLLDANRIRRFDAKRHGRGTTEKAE